MDFILLIGWVILGTILFGIAHKILDITYFGCSGIFSVWFGCMAAVAIGFYLAGNFVMWIVSLILGFITGYYKWIIGVVVFLIILGMLGSNSDKKNQGVEEIAGKEE